MENSKITIVAPIDEPLEEVEVPVVTKMQISDFTMHEIIGIGNFGQVVRAVSKENKTEFAIKMIKKD